LALTSPTGGGRSVGMVRSRTKATEFSYYGLVLKVRSSIMTVSRGVVHSLYFIFNHISSPALHWAKSAPSNWPVSFFGKFTKPVGVKSAPQNTKRL